MINLQAKKSKLTLKEAAKINPSILDEVDLLLTQAQLEERKMLVTEMAQGGMDLQPRDPHYGLYESISTPAKVELDKEFIFGVPKKDAKEAIEAIPVSEVTRLKYLYESFMGGDDIPANLNSNGVMLRRRQSQAELRLVQLIVNSRYRIDPYVRSIINTFSRYLIGTGIRVNVENNTIQDVIDTFCKTIDLREVYNDFIRTSFKDGEVGASIYSKIVNKSSSIKQTRVDWKWTKVFSEEVRGFEYDAENPGKKYAYFKQYASIEDNKYINMDRWIADIEYWFDKNTKGNTTTTFGMKSNKDLSKDEVFLWFKHGDMRELRGAVPLEPALRDLRLYEDFRISRAVLNYERSKVLYVHTSKNIKKVAGEFKKSASPKGGVQLNIPAGDEYSMETASLQAQDADHDGLLFLYAVGSAVTMPVYLFAIRADQQNYSAIKNTDSPFNQMIQDYANRFTSNLHKLLRWVISRYIEAGILTETIQIKRVAREKQVQWEGLMTQVTKLLVEATVVPSGTADSLSSSFEETMEDVTINTIDIPLNINLADSIKADPLDLAKVAFIERNLGLVSSQTLAEERGRNWQQELMRMLREKEIGIFTPSSAQKGSSQAEGGSDVQTGDGVNTGKGGK